MHKSRESIEHVTERFAHNGNESRGHFFKLKVRKRIVHVHLRWNENMGQWCISSAENWGGHTVSTQEISSIFVIIISSSCQMKNIVLYLENAELMYSTVISLRQGKKKNKNRVEKKKSLLGSQSRVSTLEASCKFRSRLGFGKCQGLYIPVRRKWNVPLGDFYCKLWVIHEFKAHLNLFLIRKNLGWLGYGSYRLLRYLWRPSGDGLSLPL